MFNKTNPEDMELVKEQYHEYDKKLEGMNQRAGIAELVLGFIILFILNCGIIIVCKLYNKEQSKKNMKATVEQEVSQYFKLAAEDVDGSNSSSPSQN